MKIELAHNSPIPVSFILNAETDLKAFGSPTSPGPIMEVISENVKIAGYIIAPRIDSNHPRCFIFDLRCKTIKLPLNALVNSIKTVCKKLNLNNILESLKDNTNSLLTIDLSTLQYDQIKLIVENLTKVMTLSGCIEHFKSIFNANNIEWKFNVVQNAVWMQIMEGSINTNNIEQYKSFLIKYGVSASKVSIGLDSTTKRPTLIIKSPSILELQHLPTFSITPSLHNEEKKASLNPNVDRGTKVTGNKKDATPLTTQFASLNIQSHEVNHNPSLVNKEDTSKAFGRKGL